MIKPGEQIDKLSDNDMTGIDTKQKGNTMISRGLLLEDVPSKGIIGANDDSEIEEVPLPDDDDDDE